MRRRFGRPVLKTFVHSCTPSLHYQHARQNTERRTLIVHDSGWHLTLTPVQREPSPSPR
jgi:hypothetical protein